MWREAAGQAFRDAELTNGWLYDDARTISSAGRTS
jgi:hypothetical protein